jgi:hypothetical protein
MAATLPGCPSLCQCFITSLYHIHQFSAGNSLSTNRERIIKARGLIGYVQSHLEVCRRRSNLQLPSLFLNYTHFLNFFIAEFLLMWVMPHACLSNPLDSHCAPSVDDLRIPANYISCCSGCRNQCYWCSTNPAKNEGLLSIRVQDAVWGQ